MKKIVFSLLFIFGISALSFAQLKNKNGEKILPEAGEFSIGVDATPFINYLGNFFNGTIGNSTSWSFVDNVTQSVLAKYMIDEKSAYRIGLRVGFVHNSVTNNLVQKDGDPAKYVQDKASQSDMNVVLMAGKEFRRGKGRLQGFYGAEAHLAFGTSNVNFTYGNGFVTAYPTPLTTSWTAARGSAPTPTGMAVQSSRPLSQGFGTIFGIGARAFGGVEYFILPKLSFGGEFGWGIGLLSMGKGKMTTESWTGTETKSTTIETVGASQFGIDTDNVNGRLVLQFYF